MSGLKEEEPWGPAENCHCSGMTAKRAKSYFQRREDSTANHHCCVPKCAASARRNSVLSFHTFPKNGELRQKWLINIRRDHLTVTDAVRVCSRHFTTAELIEPSTPAGRRLLKKGAVPVLFEWNSYCLPATRRGVWPRRGWPDPPDGNELTVDIRHSDHDYCFNTEPAAVDLSLEGNEELQAENTSLQKQMQERAINSKFGLERFASSDDDIRFCTRFASYGRLMSFWSQIEPVVHNILRVTRARTESQTEEARQAVNAKSLQLIEEFFLFMTYLSLGPMEQDLGHRFGIHPSTVSRIINTWANLLYNVLGAVGIWLDEETVKNNMPEVFHHFSDTHIILNCAELRCQTPGSLRLQSEVFSSSKSHCTFKGLIGIAPHGPVTFVSPLYEGSVSDRELLKQSGLVSLLKPSMAIMVDKGFPVEDIVPCSVHKPAFFKKKSQLSGPEVSLRAHVERVIRRVKQHKLFGTEIPLSLSGSTNQLFAVACLLINYQNGPLV